METSLAVALVGTLLLAAARPGPSVEAVVKKIRDASFTSEKDALAIELAKRATPEAKAALLQLLQDDHYWNRGAAIEGLFALKDPTVCGPLWSAGISDHMIDDKVQKGMRLNAAVCGATLRARYAPSLDSKQRALLLEVIAASSDAEVEPFLTALVADRKAPDRALAFELFARQRATVAAIRQATTEPGLEEPALAALVLRGSVTDLPVFLALLEKPRSLKTTLVAMEAVKRWGTIEQKKHALVRGLAQADDSVQRGALATFASLKGDDLVNPLCRTVKRSSWQSVRLAAAEHLAAFETKRVVPCLVQALRETYEAPRTMNAAELALSSLTFGIISIADTFHRDSDKSSFSATLHRIGAALKRLTGADHGTSYDRWIEWALLRGYSVNGRNLTQQLFSSLPTTRAQAVETSIRLLGARDRRDFAAKNAGAPSEDLELRLFLARRLTESKLVEDEVE